MWYVLLISTSEEGYCAAGVEEGNIMFKGLEQLLYPETLKSLGLEETAGLGQM